MGKKVNAQAVEGHTEYVAAVYEMSKLILERFSSPFLTNDFIFVLSPTGRRQRKVLDFLHNHTRKVIAERKKNLPEENSGQEEGKPAFLDTLIKAQRDGEDITDENIREEVDTFMFEGFPSFLPDLIVDNHLNTVRRKLEPKFIYDE